jgi:hypothetical protein
MAEMAQRQTQNPITDECERVANARERVAKASAQMMADMDAWMHPEIAANRECGEGGAANRQAQTPQGDSTRPMGLIERLSRRAIESENDAAKVRQSLSIIQEHPEFMDYLQLERNLRELGEI